MKVQLNPDNAIVVMIKERLKVTGGQCPCVPEPFWSEDTKCPCTELKENNVCHCGLYVQIEETIEGENT